ncbi:unnamed protein product [Microthlaspi erraticum]|uniref:Uncharacterized protein n=1 Tax=Microthlaspi erraticum TaxID=1685480 RepID=A0A6D2K6X4_9BRAS|nr:unnamed protein product [Microthlaspi erraticum]
MSFSNSPSTPDQRLKTIVVAMTTEKKTMNNPKRSSLEEVVFENMIPIERPSFGLGVFRTEITEESGAKLLPWTRLYDEVV